MFGGNSWEWVVAYHGIAKTGAVINPLSSMLTMDELGYTISDAGARIVLAAQDKADQMRALRDAGVLEHVVVAACGLTEDSERLDGWLDGGHDVTCAIPVRKGFDASRFREPARPTRGVAHRDLPSRRRTPGMRSGLPRTVALRGVSR